MFSRECNECNNLSKTLHEREANITTYKNNLFELKLKIIQSNDLINNYINYKKENENLKKEVAIAKSQSETGKISHINYEKELLKNKYLKECEKNHALQLLNNQINAMLEESKIGSEHKTELMKMKKELSEKERIINNHLLSIEKLKLQIKEMKNAEKTMLDAISSKTKEEKSKHSQNLNCKNKDLTGNINENQKDILINTNKIQNNEFDLKLDFNSLNDSSSERHSRISNILNYQKTEKIENEFTNISNKNKDIDQEDLNDAYLAPKTKSNVENLNMKKTQNNEYNHYSVSNQNIKDLIRENEYLKSKYQKYEKKYIKHKSINKFYKNIVKKMRKESSKEKDYFIRKIIEAKNSFIEPEKISYNPNIVGYQEFRDQNFSNSKNLKSKILVTNNIQDNQDYNIDHNYEELYHQKYYSNEKIKEEKKDLVSSSSISYSIKDYNNSKNIIKKINNSKIRDSYSGCDGNKSINLELKENKSYVTNNKYNSESEISFNIDRDLTNNSIKKDNNKVSIKNLLVDHINSDEDDNLDENNFNNRNDINQNALIENYRNGQINKFTLLQKKMLKKKKNKKVNDSFEKIKQEHQQLRRSMRIKINSLKSDYNQTKKISRRNPEENKNTKKNTNNNKGNQKINEILKGETKEKVNSINNKPIIQKSPDKLLTQAISVAEMLRRNREGEKVFYEFSIKDEQEPQEKKKAGNNKNLIGKNKNQEKLKNESNKKKLNIANKIQDTREDVNDLMEIPESNKIMKVNLHKDNHKNPIKFTKKSNTEILEILNKKIKENLLDYMTNKIHYIEIFNYFRYDNLNNEVRGRPSNSLEDVDKENFDIFTVKGLEIEKIFSQKLEEENIINPCELTIYEKIELVYELIFDNAKCLDIGKVFIFIFSFLKNIILHSAKIYNQTEIYEILFGYFSEKINKICSNNTISSKIHFMNFFSSEFDTSIFDADIQGNKTLITEIIFGKIFLKFENKNLYQRLFINNEFSDIEYFIAYNLNLLFLFNFKNIYNKKDFDINNEFLYVKNFDFFRLTQDIILGFNYNSNKYYFTLMRKIFELFCILNENLNMNNLIISESLYEEKYLTESLNNMMFAENLKDKMYTRNFVFIIKKIFLCDSDQMVYFSQFVEEKEKEISKTININQSNDENKIDNKNNKSLTEIPLLGKQNLILQIFGNLAIDLINNPILNNNHDSSLSNIIDRSFRDFYNKFNIQKMIEITQFFEFVSKIYEFSVIYPPIFQGFLWGEFVKYDEKNYKRRIIIFLIAMLFKFALKEDYSCKYDQTKDLMNWLYAIVDPKFEGAKIHPMERVIALYALMDLCKFDPNFIDAIKVFVTDILRTLKIENFPDDLKEKIEKKHSFTLESIINKVNNSFNNIQANNDQINNNNVKLSDERIIVENR